MTISHLDTCTSIVEVRWISVIPTCQFWCCLTIKDCTVVNVLVIIDWCYFFSSSIISNWWFWNSDELVITNIYIFLVACWLVFFLRCECNQTSFSRNAVWTNNIIFITKCIILVTKSVSITATWSIKSCDIRWNFTWDNPFWTIPVRDRNHYLKWVLIWNVNSSSTKICVTRFCNNFTVLDCQSRTICVRIVSTANSITINVFRFYCKWTWTLRCFNISCTIPVVKRVKCYDSITLTKVEHFTIFIVKLNIYSYFNRFILISWRSNCHSYCWILTDFRDTFSIVWRKANDFVTVYNTFDCWCFILNNHAWLVQTIISNNKFVTFFNLNPLIFSVCPRTVWNNVRCL